MGKWYIGNLNLKENRREKNGVTYYVRGVREVEGSRFERYAVKTHFVERGDDYIELVRRYVLPIYQPGDIVSLGEKVISMCQDNTVEIGKVRLGFWAKFLSKFATRNQYGIGMDEPYKPARNQHERAAADIACEFLRGGLPAFRSARGFLQGCRPGRRGD